MSHINIVLTIVVIFAFFQMILYVRIFRKRSRYLNGVQRLMKRTASGGAEVGIEWFDLFSSSARNSLLLVSAKTTAIEHAEEQIYSINEYAILQRLGNMAPLIGVILTAIGFLTINEALSNLSSFAPPLASGVLAGAVLSVLNQAFLVRADMDLQFCMQQSRKLIDQFWQQQASRLIDSNAQLLRIAKSFDDTVNRLSSIIDQFPSDVSVLNTKFTNIATIATSTYASINKLAPSLESVTAAWRRATNFFQESVETKFVDSVQALCVCAQSLPTVVRTLEAVTVDMRAVTKQFEASSDRQTELTSANASWAKDVLETQTSELNKSVSQLSAPIAQAGSALQHLAPVLERSSVALDGFTKLSQSYSQMVNDELAPAKQLMTDLASSAKGLSQIVDSLKKTVEHLESSTSQNLDLHNSLDFTVRARAIPTIEVLQRATGTFEDASHRLAECAEGLQMSLQNLLSTDSGNSRNVTQNTPSLEVVASHKADTDAAI